MHLSATAKKLIIRICLTAVAFMAAGILYYRSIEALYFALGVLLMSAVNIVKVVMLDGTVERILDQSESSAGKNIARLQFLLRYVLTGAGLVASYYIPYTNIWGAVAGLFTFQIAVYTVNVGMKRMPKANENVPAQSGSSEKEGG